MLKTFLALTICLEASFGLAQANSQTQAIPQTQSTTAAQGGPPPQAYEDCVGKKVGEQIKHRTPQGLVPALCEESPKGLVARPIGLHPQPAPAQNGSGNSVNGTK